MTLGNRKRHPPEVAAEPSPPALVTRQLEQVRGLMRVRKVTAVIELSVARRVLAECEKQVEAARSELADTEVRTGDARRAGRRQMSNGKSSTSDLLRWQRRELSLIADVEEHRSRLEAVQVDVKTALGEVERKSARQRLLMVGEEKYSAMLDDIESNS